MALEGSTSQDFVNFVQKLGWKRLADKVADLRLDGTMLAVLTLEELETLGVRAAHARFLRHKYTESRLVRDNGKALGILDHHVAGVASRLEEAGLGVALVLYFTAQDWLDLKLAAKDADFLARSAGDILLQSLGPKLGLELDSIDLRGSVASFGPDWSSDARALEQAGIDGALFHVLRPDDFDALGITRSHAKVFLHLQAASSPDPKVEIQRSIQVSAVGEARALVEKILPDLKKQLPKDFPDAQQKALWRNLFPYFEDYLKCSDAAVKSLLGLQLRQHCYKIRQQHRSLLPILEELKAFEGRSMVNAVEDYFPEILSFDATKAAQREVHKVERDALLRRRKELKASIERDEELVTKKNSELKTTQESLYSLDKALEAFLKSHFASEKKKREELEASRHAELLVLESTLAAKLSTLPALPTLPSIVVVVDIEFEHLDVLTSLTIPCSLVVVDVTPRMLGQNLTLTKDCVEALKTLQEQYVLGQERQWTRLSEFLNPFRSSLTWCILLAQQDISHFPVDEKFKTFKSLTREQALAEFKQRNTEFAQLDQERTKLAKSNEVKAKVLKDFHATKVRQWEATGKALLQTFLNTQNQLVQLTDTAKADWGKFGPLDQDVRSLATEIKTLKATLAENSELLALLEKQLVEVDESLKETESTETEEKVAKQSMYHALQKTGFKRLDDLRKWQQHLQKLVPLVALGTNQMRDAVQYSGDLLLSFVSGQQAAENALIKLQGAIRSSVSH